MSFKKISVLIPTRNRLTRLCTMLTSYELTTRGTETLSELVFRVDEDDLESQNFLQGRNVVVGPRLQGYRSMPLFFNEMVSAAAGDVFMCGNDDMIFKTLGWAQVLLTAANQFPDGIFDLGVTTHNETHYPFSTVSRKAVDQLGFLWDPRIFWGDIFLRDTMAAFGRTAMVPSVEIEHDWAGHSPDQVFLESEKDITQTDPTYWSRTHSNAVAEAYRKLAALEDSSHVGSLR